MQRAVLAGGLLEETIAVGVTKVNSRGAPVIGSGRKKASSDEKERRDSGKTQPRWA